MLKSFRVNNFRLFQHIEIERLGRVNLIVGKNNAGKSAFLEAIELYASNASSQIILDIVESRQETWVSEAQPYFPNFLSNPIRHLFFGHKFPKFEEKGIILEDVSSNTKLHITVAAYQNQYDDDEEVSRRIRVHYLDFDENIASFDIVLIVEENQKTRRLFRLDKNIKEIKRSSRFFYELRESDIKYVWQFVPTENMPNRKLAALWDLTILTNLESEIIDALKLIEPKVSGVAFVEDISKGRSSDNRIPLVKIEGIDEPLPLKSMGDGITRLFHIIVSLVNARDGLLLIDEFENGLHWSVQPKVWDIVFYLSERLNVQVFATTHSRDCIEGFDSAWNKYPSLGAFFRLEAKDKRIKVIEYTSDTLTDAIEMDVEVR
jgi:AAA15 family ATPase/GTPase